MKIRGNRVYLELPEIKESKFSISDELKKELKNKEMEKFDRLKVFGVAQPYESSGIIESDLKVGDEVFVDPMGLKKGVFLKIGDKEIVSVSSFDIMHSW